MRPAAPEATRSVERFFQFAVLGMLATGYLALATSGALDLASIVLTGGGLLLRLALILRIVRFDVNPRLVAAATLAYFGFYPLDVLYLTRDFVPATIHLICFLAVVRVLSARTDRDYFFVKVIAFLELLAATLLSASITFFTFFLLFVIFGVATFCCTEIRRAAKSTDQTIVLAPGGVSRFGRRLGVLTAAMTVGIVVMTGGLFFMLPRTARAAFRSFVPERYHLPGFSNEVTLGQIGEIQQRSTPVMHVRIEAPNDKLPLKWRGAALSQFDGRRWYNPTGPLERVYVTSKMTQLVTDAERLRPVQLLSYEVRVGPVDTDTLFFAGVPEFIQTDDIRVLYRAPGDSYRIGHGSAEGRRYLALGQMPGPVPAAPAVPLSAVAHNEYLLLPASLDLRIFQLAQDIGRGRTSLEKADAIEHYLQTKFGYTTELPSERLTDPLAHFLFERKEGHCEYFASAMAVMLRSLYIPARVVTGFQSGTYNPMTGWHVIRASDAHSWVEAWLPDRGWTTFDPTPPDMRGSQGASAMWSRLLLYLDAMDTWWRDWIVNYNLDSQVDLVSRLERQTRIISSSESWTERLKVAGEHAVRGFRAVVVYGALLGAAALLIWIFGPAMREWITARRQAVRLSRGQVESSDAAILYRRMLKALRRRGIEKPGWLTPAEFARIVPAASPDAVLVEQITEAYHDLRYAARAEAGARMILLIEQLESQRQVRASGRRLSS